MTDPHGSTTQNREDGRGADAHSSRALLPVGMEAPDFTLNSGPTKAQSLHDLRGKATVLVFYPADWSPVCGDQLALYNELADQWDELNASLVGISVDSVWCHKAYSDSRKLRFPLLADFEPKGAVARMYNAYRESDGTSQRALFVLDADGVIRWNYLSPVGVNPGADGILKALENMTSEQRGETAPTDARTSPAAARSTPEREKDSGARA
jgi:peroxiredoxin